MLGKKLTIIISIIYGILLLFYTLAFSFGNIPCEGSEKNCVSFCCGDDSGSDCDANEIHKNFKDLHSYSNVIPELENENFTVTPLNRYRCKLIEIPDYEKINHWKEERGKHHFQNNILERFCLTEVEYAHHHEPSKDWKLMSCQIKMETFEIISIVVSVLCIIVTIVCMFVKKQLRLSIYGKCAMGLVGAYPNIFTARTLPDNSLLFLLLHAVAFIMISLWMVSMAFEVWYSLKFFKTGKETTLRTIFYFAFTHILFLVFCYYFLSYVLQYTDQFSFTRPEIAERFKFGTFSMILIYMIVVIPLNVICVFEYWTKEEEYKDIDYDRCMLIGERLAANILVSVINLILFAMCYENWAENTVNNSNIRTMEFLRCVTEILSAKVIFFIFVIYQLRKEGEYELRVDTEVPDTVPMSGDFQKRTLKEK